MSARNRVPLTGRSNRSQEGVGPASSRSASKVPFKNLHGQHAHREADHHEILEEMLHPSQHHYHKHHVNKAAMHHAHAAGLAYSARTESSKGSARSEGPSSHPSAVSTARRELTSARVEELNNPLEVFRPYSPEITKSTAHLERPPILPKSRHPTVPAVDPTLGVKTRRRKSVCPPGFEDANMAPSWFETIDQGSALLDHETKVKFCREFIEKNRDRMWKFDLAFMGKGPLEVADMLTDNPGLLTRMKKFNFKERALNLSSSDQFTAAFSDDHLKMKTSRQIRDPYVPSLHTSREKRAYEMTNLMTAPGAMQQWGHGNCRGFKHTVEIGNFSDFTGLLNLNKEAMLNR